MKNTNIDSRREGEGCTEYENISKGIINSLF